MKHFENNENKPLVKIHSQLNDCIVVSHIDTSLLDISPKSEEVIIDIATGQSALRGSHIFAPGIMAMTPGKIILFYVKIYFKPIRIVIYMLVMGIESKI